MVEHPAGVAAVGQDGRLAKLRQLGQVHLKIVVSEEEQILQTDRLIEAVDLDVVSVARVVWKLRAVPREMQKDDVVVFAACDEPVEGLADIRAGGRLGPRVDVVEHDYALGREALRQQDRADDVGVINAAGEGVGCRRV